MNIISHLSAEQLRRATSIQEKIEGLQKELSALLTPVGTSAAGAPALAGAKTSSRSRSRTSSKSNGSPASVPPSRRPKGIMSPAVRAKISASQKARHARARAQQNS